MTDHEGGCLCGAIRYAAVAPPCRVTVCHCRFCQKATGAAYVIEPLFARADIKTVFGEPKIYQHRSEGSGKTVYVNFCASCGTKLFQTFERYTDLVGVFAGTFDDPNWFEVSATTSKHVFVSMGRHGTIIPAGFNVFEAHAVAFDGSALTPIVFDKHHIVGS